MEYKTWLNLTDNRHKATIAKAAIALANHGGGYVVVGFDDQGHRLVPVERPSGVPEISQDAVNAAIQRFATPNFHCEVYNVRLPGTQLNHPIIAVPGTLTEPVMSKRDCEGVITKHRCYIRKPGPCSEEPQTAEEWRTLLRRCVLATREDMLQAIRSIVSGRVEPAEVPPNTQLELDAFCQAAHARWVEVVEELPADASGRFPLGYYEMGFSLVGAQPAPNLVELEGRLAAAHKVKLTGWPTFLKMMTPEWAPYAHEDFVEAWVGRPTQRGRNFEDPAHSDFWRASRDGKLYTIRGYAEDGMPGRVAPGSAIDVALPVWRVGEGLLFVTRLAERFDDVEALAVQCRFAGLNKRHLTSVDRNRAIFDDRVSHTQDVTLSGRITLDQVRDNLVEFMRELLAPLYERFDFFALPSELVDTELGRLRGARF